MTSLFTLCFGNDEAGFDENAIVACLRGEPKQITPPTWGALLLHMVALHQSNFDDPNDAFAVDFAAGNTEQLAEIFMSSYWRNLQNNTNTIKVLGWDDTEGYSKVPDDWHSGNFWTVRAIVGEWTLHSCPATAATLLRFDFEDEGYAYFIWVAAYHNALSFEDDIDL